MTHCTKTLGLMLLAITAFSGVAISAEKVHYIDLQPQANRKLTDNQGRGFPGNSLASLPTGEQKLGDSKFQIGPGLIQLGSQVLEKQPAEVKDIKVGKKFTKLVILQAVCFGGGPNTEGSEWHIKDGTVLGHYLVHYKDKSTEKIPIVYGEDVRDWFYEDGEKEPSKAKVVWKGDNEIAASVGCHLRLYAATWINPKPDVKVTRIDFVALKGDTPGAPVCLAMTAIKEKPKDKAKAEAEAKAKTNTFTEK
ncbi:MAG TPA: hypothetical protein VGJ26_15880 [Pirellulales bacterium]|jgi:hypothetical protein